MVLGKMGIRPQIDRSTRRSTIMITTRAVDATIKGMKYRAPRYRLSDGIFFPPSAEYTRIQASAGSVFGPEVFRL